MDGNTPSVEKDDLREIALDLVDESPTNPRKRFDPVALQELAASIKGKGLIAPATVRPVGDRFELVVGARRYRGCKIAGRGTILALVRTLTDREVREIQLEENGQRQDVHPLEEADAYQHLQELGAPIEELAARTGKPVGYVRQRLQYCALGPEAREAFLDGKLTPATALLVARIPVPKLQVTATTEVTTSRFGNDGPMSPRQAGEWIRGRYMLRLADAPFKRDDVTLVPNAGACTTCPKRTGAQPELFDDVDSPDVCTDPDCFGAKKDADWERRAKAAKAQGQEVLPAKKAKDVFHHGGRVAYNADYVDLAEKPYDLGDGRKSYKGLLGKGNLPPVALARDGEGGIHELVKKEDLKKALKAAGITKETVGGGASDSYKAQQKKDRERQELKRAVVNVAVAKVVEEAEAVPPSNEFWRFVAETFTRASWHDVITDVAKRRGLKPTGKKGVAVKNTRAEDLVEQAIKSMKPATLRGLVVEILATRGAAPMYAGEKFGENLRAACELYGIDLAKIETTVKTEKAAEKKAKGKKGRRPGPKKTKSARAAAQEIEEPADGDDEDDSDDPESPEVRVWIELRAWDALSEIDQTALGEPVDGCVVDWYELDVYMSTLVPEGEVLEAIREECRRVKVQLFEGEDHPTTRPEANADVRVWLSTAALARLPKPTQESYENPDADLVVAWEDRGEWRTAVVARPMLITLRRMADEDSIKLHEGDTQPVAAETTNGREGEPPRPKAGRVLFILSRKVWNALDVIHKKMLTHPFGPEIPWRVQRTAVTTEGSMDPGSPLYDRLNELRTNFQEFGLIEVPADVRQCVDCGCVEQLACGKGCSWFSERLCSACDKLNKKRDARKAAEVEPAEVEQPETPATGAEVATELHELGREHGITGEVAERMAAEIGETVSADEPTKPRVDELVFFRGEDNGCAIESITATDLVVSVNGMDFEVPRETIRWSGRWQTSVSRPETTTLRVSAETWQKHKSGLGDTSTGALHKRWMLSDGDQRVVTFVSGTGNYDKIRAYAQKHKIELFCGDRRVSPEEETFAAAKKRTKKGAA